MNNFPRYLMDPAGIKISSINQNTREKTAYVYLPMGRERSNWRRRLGFFMFSLAISFGAGMAIYGVLHG